MQRPFSRRNMHDMELDAWDSFFPSFTESLSHLESFLETLLGESWQVSQRGLFAYGEMVFLDSGRPHAESLPESRQNELELFCGICRLMDRFIGETRAKVSHLEFVRSQTPLFQIATIDGGEWDLSTMSRFSRDYQALFPRFYSKWENQIMHQFGLLVRNLVVELFMTRVRDSFWDFTDLVRDSLDVGDSTEVGFYLEERDPTDDLTYEVGFLDVEAVPPLLTIDTFNYYAMMEHTTWYEIENDYREEWAIDNQEELDEYMEEHFEGLTPEEYAEERDEAIYENFQMVQNEYHDDMVGEFVEREGQFFWSAILVNIRQKLIQMMVYNL